MNKRFGALSSSANPQELAATVTGIIKALGGFLVFLGVSSVAGEIDTLADQVSTLVTLGITFWGIAESAFGILRKIFITVYDKFLA